MSILDRLDARWNRFADNWNSVAVDCWVEFERDERTGMRAISVSCPIGVLCVSWHHYGRAAQVIVDALPPRHP